MTRYLLSVHTGADTRPAEMTGDEVQQGYARVAALEQEMKSSGALLFSGRLEAPSAAKVVRASRGGVLGGGGGGVRVVGDGRERCRTHSRRTMLLSRGSRVPRPT